MSMLYRFDVDDGRLLSAIVKDRPSMDYLYRADLTEVEPPEPDGVLWPKWTGSAWVMFDFNAPPAFDAEKARAEKWKQIKAARELAELDVFTWNGHQFDGDLNATRRINGAVTLALVAMTLGEPFTIDWTLADNSMITLSGPDMLAVGVALGQSAGGAHARAAALRTQIQSATTQAELDAISWVA